MTDSVFAPPTRTRGPQPAAVAASSGPGPDDIVNTTLYLTHRQTLHLDRLATDIRANTGAKLSRVELIRGILNAVAEANVDLSHSPSEADITAAVLARMKR